AAPSSGDDFWFDFMSDTGDGQKAIYNLAYLCLSDLWIPNPAIPGAGVVSLETVDNGFKLPRGEFLFVGGDAAYHIADYETLVERFQTPFDWAYDDRVRDIDVPRRPIYAIPANHDYYDALDGFNRQFRRPFNPDRTYDPRRQGPQPQLCLKGFERVQEATYMALKLPHEWWLWGLDAQEGRIDERQAAFFRELCNPGIADLAEEPPSIQSPDRLIVVTPEPSTVFGKWAGADTAIVKTFQRLGLEPTFLDKQDGRLPNGKCRLDLSGDTHHYARYWGKRPHKSKPKDRDNYASVVAGGGGAFLHPSHTDIGEVDESRLYPTRLDSHRLATQRILQPWNIMRGGYVWLAGALVALLAYFAATVPESSWSIFGLVPNELRPMGIHGVDGLLGRIQKALTVPTGSFASAYLWDLLYAVLLLAALAVSAVRHSKLFTSFAKMKSAVEAEALWKQIRLSLIGFHLVPFVPILVLVYREAEAMPHPLLSTPLMLLFLAAAAINVGMMRRYSDALTSRARILGAEGAAQEGAPRLTWMERIRRTVMKHVRLDEAPLWVLALAAASSACFGVWHYGVYRASVVFTDVLTLLAVVLAPVGVVYFAVAVGATLIRDRRGKLRFLGLGIWHALLQAAVPVLLVAWGSWTLVVGIVTITVAATVLAGWAVTRDGAGDPTLADQERRANQLLYLWIALGTVPFVAVLIGGQPKPVTGYRLIGAFALGAILSCVWFGWYLAVSLGFNGHNNEAGGASRSDSYRHFIRFRLTATELTGYAIGVDEPVESFTAAGVKPRFRMIDVFTIAPK
ncbi:MAG: hypothetical protein LC647_02380, partial [Beggiatoa sp.]|nr:hypothetical protein [Beggiatoa sp.]